MSVPLKQVIGDLIPDSSLQTEFLALWPAVESMLNGLANNTGLPIFAFLDELAVFQSDPNRMPAFCRAMLADNDLRSKCISDAAHRSARSESRHLCHAGYLNSQFSVDTRCGPTLSILFGSQHIDSPEASRARDSLINLVTAARPDMGPSLAAAAQKQMTETAKENASLTNLMRSLARVLDKLFAETMGKQSAIINLAHELSGFLIGMASTSTLMEELTPPASPDAEVNKLLSQIKDLARRYRTHAQLGLYMTSNFLSFASESRYREASKPRFESVDLCEVVRDTVELHRANALRRGISFDDDELGELPKVRGIEMDLRRVLHNVVNNAVKYSYRSTDHAQRHIKFQSRVPFEHSASKSSFAIRVSNYGLGVEPEEHSQVYRPGFRGRQARTQVPMGAGIGLSEAAKIMKLHGGAVRLRSAPLHLEPSGDMTYLTTVDLIFPYAAK